VDGETRISLKTSKKGLAEHRLKDYIKGKYGLTPTPTVEDFFERWIQGKVEPLFRRGLIRDYRQHFKAYILPTYKDVRLAAIGNKDLAEFRLTLLGKKLSIKTVRNIIDGSFRAAYRDARAELDELKGKDPFIDLQWPKNQKPKPRPFTLEEKEKILEFFLEHEPFYYPFVLIAI
jgi:hypothetical protein